ncbi:MAG: hypothetical protein WCS20_06945 [Alphaproteobacteria bacterium]|jgi:hypothetical protein
MRFGYALLAMFGIFAAKPTTPDMFDLRLERIVARESDRQARPILFRPKPQPLQA